MESIVKVNKRSQSMVPALIIESKITNLSVVYMDVLNILFAEIGKDSDIDENLNYSISAATYKELKKIGDIRDAYKTLKGKVWGNGEKDKGMDTIFIQQVTKGGEMGERLRPIYKVGYDEGSCYLSLAPEFKKMLVDVKRQNGARIFSSLQYTLPMKSVYSKKVYMMCKRYEDKGIRFTEKYDWASFRERVGVPDSYNDRKVEDRVLVQAQKEINYCSDIKINYEIIYKDNQNIRKTPLGIIIHVSPKEKALLERMELEEDQMPGQMNMEDLPCFIFENETEENNEGIKEKIHSILPGMKLADIDTVIMLGNNHSWKGEQLISLAEYTQNHDIKETATGYMIRIITTKTGEEFGEVYKHKKKGSFCDIQQNDYDFEKLEKAMSAY